jgi:hypothetical protein
MSRSIRTFLGSGIGAACECLAGGWAKPANAHASQSDGTNHRVLRLMTLVLARQRREDGLAVVSIRLILPRGRSAREERVFSGVLGTRQSSAEVRMLDDRPEVCSGFDQRQ